MIKVDLDKIITAKALQEHLEQILLETEEEEKLFVITKNGRPKAALINVDYLQELTGRNVDEAEEYEAYDRFATPAAVAGRPNIESPVASNTTSPVTPNNESASTGASEPAVNVKIEEPEEPVENLDLPELNIEELDLNDEEPAETVEPAVQMPVSPVTPPAPPLSPQPQTSPDQPL